MALTVASGTAETVESGTTSYGDPVTVAGELSVDGQVTVTETAQVSAAGAGGATGTAQTTRTLYLGRTARPALIVAAGDTETIAAGTTAIHESAQVGGGLQLNGTLELSDEALVAGAGALGATGTATDTRVRDQSAAGAGGATGTADPGPVRDVSASGSSGAAGQATPSTAIPLIRESDRTLNTDSDQ